MSAEQELICELRTSRAAAWWVVGFVAMLLLCLSAALASRERELGACEGRVSVRSADK